jgi:hypothetical protein
VAKSTIEETTEAESGQFLGKALGILSDLRLYFFHKPSIPTLIAFPSETERENYSLRIMQRLGIDVTKYKILNIHQIGIEAPLQHVFEELRMLDLRCWPNHIATVDRIDGGIEHLRFFLLGMKKRLLGLTNHIFGLTFVPLFDLKAIRFQESPSSSEVDNARYLLYECSGGYPIGVYTAYVRSPIADQEETEPSQFFLIVGFNFYGRTDWPRIGLINKIWEGIHNRVTANILNRFKQLCEATFQEALEGK